MPLYEYRCTQCGNRFEKIQSFNAEPEKTCPKCGGPVERPLTAPAFQFKGAGWYVNDYAPKPASSGNSTGTDSKPSTETKPSTDSAPAASESKPAATTPSSSTGS